MYIGVHMNVINNFRVYSCRFYLDSELGCPMRIYIGVRPEGIGGSPRVIY